MQKPIAQSKGVVTRPSDGKPPKKIAWLQCVGSREINKCDAPYCSSVCCMYALKEASHIKDSSPETEATIFFMDIRTHGKGYERYLNNALAKGVKLVRSRIHSIEKFPGTENLVLEYVDEKGEKQAEVFDLVVLSVGLRPSPGVKEVAEKLGVKTNKYGFIETSELVPGETNVNGVFACGAAVGPRDVHQSVVDAQAVAAKVSKLLGGNGAKPKSLSLRDVSNEEPKVGVVFSLCPGRSASFEKLIGDLDSYVKTLPGVVATERIDLQNSAAFKTLATWIQKSGINRLVYASCSPIMHKEMVEWAMKEAQLNPTLYSFVDLRTLGESDKEAKRLKDLMRSSVLHARMSEPLTVKPMPIEQSVLVVGGGIAGMTTALALADQGIDVILVEKKDRLGGHGHKVKNTWNGLSVQDLLKDLTSRVSSNPKIKVLLNTIVWEQRDLADNLNRLYL
jgi:heterodisulfide reductase subunit A